MDNPITRGEHEEYRHTIDARMNQIYDENVRQNKRIDKLENDMDKLTALTISVEKLSMSIERMTKEQTEINKHVTALEARDGEKWREVVKTIITCLVSGAVGYIISLI